jgi:hypothetical protein
MMLPLARQIITFNGRVLSNNTNLNTAGVKNDDLLLVTLAPERFVVSSVSV